jgi:hypothetical protein
MKRFIDTDIWKKKWFRKLDPTYKALWMYLFTNCDNAGVWDVDEEVTEFMVGDEVDFKQAIKVFNGNIKIVDNGSKWWLVDFIAFQCGELKENVRPHVFIINLLKKHRLYEEYLKGINTPKEKEQEQEQEKEQEQEETTTPEINISFDDFWEKYDYKKGVSEARQMWEGNKETKTVKKDNMVGVIITDEIRGLIMKHLDLYIPNTFKDADTFPGRRHPVTYFNKKTWLEEVEVSNKKSNVAVPANKNWRKNYAQ